MKRLVISNPNNKLDIRIESATVSSPSAVSAPPPPKPNGNGPGKYKNNLATCTPEEFVAVWTAADSVKDVMKATGLSEQAVRARYKAYKKAGVNLKPFESQRHKFFPTHKLDSANLNQVIQQVNEQLQAAGLKTDDK